MRHQFQQIIIVKIIWQVPVGKAAVDTDGMPLIGGPGSCLVNLSRPNTRDQAILSWLHSHSQSGPHYSEYRRIIDY